MRYQSLLLLTALETGLSLPAQFQSVTTQSIGPGCNMGSTGCCAIVQSPTTLTVQLDVFTNRLQLNVNALLWHDMAKSYDLRPALSALDRPVLIVHGHQDPIGDKTVEDIHRVIPKSRLHYVHRSGHFPWLEQPEAFRDIVTKFLHEVHPPKK